MINGQSKECLSVQVQLYDRTVDEQHDLLYLVPQPDQPLDFTSDSSSQPAAIPTSYKALNSSFIVELKMNWDNCQIANGLIAISALPPGRYKIYFLRPEKPEMLLQKTASVKLQKVGKGKELNIWYKSQTSSARSSFIQPNQQELLESSSSQKSITILNAKSNLNSQQRSFEFENTTKTPNRFVISQLSEVSHLEELQLFTECGGEAIPSIILPESNRKKFRQSLSPLGAARPVTPIIERSLDTQVESCRQLCRNTAGKSSARTLLANEPATDLRRAQTLNTLRAQLQRDFSSTSRQSCLQDGKSVNNTRNRLQNKQLMLETVEEIESLLSQQSTSTINYRETCLFQVSNSSRSRGKAKPQQLQCEESLLLTANNLSGEVLRDYSHYFQVDEVSNDEQDSNDVYCLQLAYQGFLLPERGSEDTTRANSKVASVLVPALAQQNQQFIGVTDTSFSFGQRKSNTSLDQKSSDKKRAKENQNKPHLRITKVVRK